MVCAGKLVPDISTEVALRHVYRSPPFQSKLHLPPAGSSVRIVSQSACDIVILKGIKPVAAGRSCHISMRVSIHIMDLAGNNGAPRLMGELCCRYGPGLGRPPRSTSALAGIFTCISASLVAHQSHGDAQCSDGQLVRRGFPNSVKLRRLSCENWAAPTGLLCTTGPTD